MESERVREAFLAYKRESLQPFREKKNFETMDF